MPYALNDVSFDVRPGEKIGIVGRTGAGKSSLFLALLRLVDIETGSIIVDGVSVQHVSLARLRYVAFSTNYHKLIHQIGSQRPHLLLPLANKVENVNQLHVWACPCITPLKCLPSMTIHGRLIHGFLGLMIPQPKPQLSRFVLFSIAHGSTSGHTDIHTTLSR